MGRLESGLVVWNRFEMRLMQRLAWMREYPNS